MSMSDFFSVSTLDRFTGLISVCADIKIVFLGTLVLF